MAIKKGITGKPVAPSKGAIPPIAKTSSVAPSVSNAKFVPASLPNAKPVAVSLPDVKPAAGTEASSDLNSARNRAIARVANDPKLRNNKEKQKELVNNILGISERGEEPPSAWGGIIGALGAVGKPVMAGLDWTSKQQGIKQILTGAGYVSRGVQATAMDFTSIVEGRIYEPLFDVLGVETDGLPEDYVYKKPTFQGWLNRVKNKEWQIYGAGPDQITTGNSKLDTGLGIATSIASDPLSYVGVGSVANMGRAGRVALSLEYGTKEMITKYPVLAEAGVLDRIIRYGAAAIPKEVRAAENVSIGLRFAGRVVPKTGAVETGWMKTGGALRAGIGDVVFNSKTNALAKGIKDVGMSLTPKYQKALVAARAGRNANVDYDTVLRPLVEFTASKYAKGASSVAHATWQRELSELGKRQRELAGVGVKNRLKGVVGAVVDPEAKNLYKYIEMSASDIASSNISDELKQLALDVKSWQDGIRANVNQGAKKFAADFGTNNREIGFIDDYIHHSLSRQAKEWIMKDGQSGAGKLYRTDDINAKDLTDPNSPIMFRKLRAPHVDPDTGQTVYSEFFGKQIMTGTIDEINSIFHDYLRKNNMEVFDWFETDFVKVADSYAASMARAKGREAFARRAMDFGSDIIKPMLQTSIPDEQLVSRLTNIHASLKMTQTTLRGKVTTNVAQAKGYAELQIKTARDFLTGNRKAHVLTTAQIAKTKKRLDETILRLAEASSLATTKDAALRGEFAMMHQAMVDEVATLRSALDNPDRYAATQELREMYISMYPNHNPVLLDQKSPEWFAEKILNARGQAQAREIRVINTRMKELRATIDDLPDTAEADAVRQTMESEYYDLAEIENAYTIVGDVRSRATYSDGFIYGTTADIVPIPEGSADFKVFRTKNTDKGFSQFPSSVAVHAPMEDAMVDLRNPEHFTTLFNDGPNGMADNIASALEEKGMPELALTMREEIATKARTGSFSPEFEQAYPELAMMIDTISFHGRVPAGTAVGDDAIHDALTDIQNQLHAVFPAVDPENVDELAREVVESALGKHMTFANGGQMDGIIVPQSWFDDAFDDPNIAGEYAVLMRPEWSAPKPNLQNTSSSQYVKDNDFIQDVLKGRYEEQSLNASLARTAKEEEINEFITQVEMSSAAKEELKKLAGRKGGITKAQNARIIKTQKAKEVLAATDSVEVTLGGTKKVITRDQAQNMIVAKETAIQRGYAKTVKDIDDAYKRLGIQADKIVEHADTLQNQLGIMFNQAKVLKTWGNTTGTVLAKDIQDMKILLRATPPRGAAAGEASAWVRKVDRSLASMDMFVDPKVKAAYERVTTLLHSNEAKLARLETVALPQIESALNMASSGWLGRVVDTTEEGWSEIYGLGVQMPDELLKVWKPNLDKLRSVANQGPFMKVLRETVNFFKIYATSSVGFFVRNGFSATFMNHVAGVQSEHMLMGIRAARAIGKGPDEWKKFLSKLPPEQAAIYETAWRATEATGRGMSDELVGLSIRGSFGEKVTNNAYTRLFQNKNNFVERAVRMPMAIDSLTRGQTFDQAVARISRYHFDYSDMSNVDEAMRKVVPFWTWTSRNVPLQVVEQWAHPQAYITYDKIASSSPVGDDVIMPKWIGDWNPIAIGGINSEGGQWVVTPDLPNVRLGQQLESITNPAKLIGQLTPLLKVPIEMSFGKQLGIDVGPFKQEKVPARGMDATILRSIAGMAGGGKLIGTDPDTGEPTIDERIPYIVQNILPTVAQLNRVTGGATGGKDSYSERQLANIMNWFGIPVRYVGPKQQKSEAIGRKIQLKEYLDQLVRDGKITKPK